MCTNDFPVKHNPSTNTNVRVRVVFVNDFVNKPPESCRFDKIGRENVKIDSICLNNDCLTDNAMKLIEKLTDCLKGRKTSFDKPGGGGAS